MDIVGRKLMLVNINTYFSLRANCWLRGGGGGVGGQFPRNVAVTYGFLRNGPDKSDSNNGNEHVGMQKRC